MFPRKAYPKPALVKKPAPTPGWRKQLQSLVAKMGADESRLRLHDGTGARIRVRHQCGRNIGPERLTVEVAQRDKKINGEWGKLKTKKVGLYEINDLADPRDRRILAMLFGSRPGTAYGYSPYYSESVYPEFVVPRPLWDVVLPLMCATARCLLRVSIIAEGTSGSPLGRWGSVGVGLEVTRVKTAVGTIPSKASPGAARRRWSCAKPVLLLAGGSGVLGQLGCAS